MPALNPSPAVVDLAFPALGRRFTSHRPFDLGGIGTVTSVRTFDVITPLALATSRRWFDIVGTVGVTSARPFDFGTSGLLVTSYRPFDVISEADGQLLDSVVYVPPYQGQPAQWLYGIQVYDKAGSRLGAITHFSISQPPSRAVNFRGVFGFHVPRVLYDPTTGDGYSNPDMALLPDDEVVKGDRLFVVGDSSRAADPWGGVLTHVEWTDGSAIVQAADVMDLLSTPQLPEDNAVRATRAIYVPENTPAANVVAVLMSQANTWFGQNGEVLWGVDASGSETFFGYETLTGDPQSALGTVVQRSFGEWSWRIALTPTTMQPVLIWRDSFSAAAGPDLVDGPEGNCVAGSSMSIDPTVIVNAIRITGSVTKIESQIPPNARVVPYAEIIPVAEVWWPTDGYRRRFNAQSAGYLWNVQVSWTIDQDTQKQKAAEEDAKNRALFKTFIHGFHSQYGRPWHEGWAWSGGVGTDGSAEDLERILTEDRYTHYRALALTGTSVIVGDPSGAAYPTAIVMKPGPRSTDGHWVRVSYNRITGQQNVTTTSAMVEVPDETVFAFEWDRYNRGDYDPRQLGVGEESPLTVVKGGSVKNGGEWRVVPYGIGDKSGSTTLAHGIDALTVDVPVMSLMPLPTTFPFVVSVGKSEDMLVTSEDQAGAILTVVRGYNGTTPKIHEAGESVEYTVADATTPPADTPPPIPPVEVAWPSGYAYASRLLAKLHRPKRAYTVHLANVGGVWSDIQIGSVHAMNLQTEGPSAGIIPTVRVLGFAPDFIAGSMELVLEDV